MERDDQLDDAGTEEMTCVASGESGQKRQAPSERGMLRVDSSPVITQERVMGSLRSSMH